MKIKRMFTLVVTGICFGFGFTAGTILFTVILGFLL